MFWEEVCCRDLRHAEGVAQRDANLRREHALLRHLGDLLDDLPFLTVDRAKRASPVTASSVTRGNKTSASQSYTRVRLAENILPRL